MSTAVYPMPTLETFKDIYISLDLGIAQKTTYWRNAQTGKVFVCPFTAIAMMRAPFSINSGNYERVWEYIHSVYGEDNVTAFIEGYDNNKTCGASDEQRAWNELGKQVRTELCDKVDWK